MALSPRALTTLATVKSELDITGPGSDARLERMIEAISEAMSREAGGRIFQYQPAAVHKIAGYGYPRLIVPCAPLLSVEEVSLIDSDGTIIHTYAPDDYSIESIENGFIRNDGNWAHTAPIGPGIMDRPLDGAERLGFKVTYECGWVTPQQAEDDNDLTRTLPFELEEACIQSTGIWFRNAQRDPTIQSQTTERQTTVYGGFSVSASEKRAGTLTLEAQAIARRYRREVEFST